ncbi:MAG: winged helix-turn-helix transcriptional regulator [Methanolobus sp.]|nr:winged helix-turn-helix transcriptional regulator [Methanolobus sp.]
MKEPKIEKMKEITRKISETTYLNETDIFILLTLMENSKITNAELAKILDFKDGNSVAYHIRNMQKENIIDKYTIVPNWKKIGLSSEFIILAEAETEEQLLQIEKKHVVEAEIYASEIGDIVVTPTISGCVVLQNVYHCFGDKNMAIIVGRATSDQDAAVYCKNYLVKKYPDIKINLLLNKYKTVNDFFIDINVVEKIKEFLQITEEESSDIMNNLGNLDR